MADQDMEKTEQATPKRQAESREKGQVAKSPEVSSVAVLMAGTAAMYYLLPGVYTNLLDITSNVLGSSGTIELTTDNFYPFWSGILRKVFFTLLLDADVNYIFSYMGHLTLKLVIWTGIVILILAAIDLGYQKWQFAKNLRMTREEVKEEYKQQEGDPLIRSRVRSMQREMARKRMMADVPKADVVITNPTHLAVALAYKHGDMNAPKVVAKGAGIIAEKIKEIARSSNVTVVENKPLARTLYKIVKIGDEIPANLYKAVAEILAYVYKLKRKG